MEEQEYRWFDSGEDTYQAEESDSPDWFSEKKPKNDNGNGCNAHFNGLGTWRHSVGDSCGCDGNPEPVPIDGGIWFLLGIAIFIIITLQIFGIFKKQIQAR